MPTTTTARQRRAINRRNTTKTPPSPAAAKRPAPKSKPKRPQAAEVKIRHVTLPPLPSDFNDKQRAAAAILASGLELPPQFRGLLPVNIEAKIRSTRPLAGEMEEMQPHTIIVEMLQDDPPVVRDDSQPPGKILNHELTAAGGEAMAQAYMPQADGSPCQSLGGISESRNPRLFPDNEADLLSWAWAIIANVDNGNWARMPEEWKKAATAWRNAYHEGPLQARLRGGMTIPALFTLGGQKIRVGLVPDLMTPQNPAQASFHSDTCAINVQRPSLTYHPSHSIMERAFCHALAAALISEAGAKTLLTDARFVESLGNGLHQFITSQSGDAEA